MYLHKGVLAARPLYTLFDSEERVTVHPTRYLDFLRERRRRETTQRHTAQVLKNHCQWIEDTFTPLGVRVDDALAMISSDDILDWINFQRDMGVSEVTICNREALVYGMYRWFLSAAGGRIREDIPWNDQKSFTRSPHRRLPRFVTMEQMCSLLQGMHNESQRVAAHFLYDTGVRVSELVRLQKQYLPNEKDWPEEVNYYPLLIPGSKPYDGSPYKFRFTIISRPVLARLRRYHATLEYSLAKGWSIFDPEKPVFLNVHGQELTVGSVQKGFRAALIRQGRDPREVSPHRCRHGTGVSILRSELGKDLLDSLLIVKSAFGHEDIRTTEIYTSIPIAALKSLSGRIQVQLKYAEAQQIYDATYLPQRGNKERRGHRR